MAFGDVAETVTAGEGYDDGIITATYSSATPAADDLNAASTYASTGATITTSGFALVIETSSVDDVALWVELVGGSGDNTATLNDGGAGDPLCMVLSLIRGPFVSATADLSGEATEDSAANPLATGASGSSTAQNSEVLIGTFGTFGSVSTGAWNRQGTATPTSAMTQSGTASGGTDLHIHQAIQVLTAIGTVGISKVNENADDANLNYATFKAGASSPVLTQTQFRFFDDGDELPHFDVPTPPVIESGDVTESYNNTASASWAISRPAQATGDLIILHLTSDANVTHGTLPGGPNGESAVVLMQHIGDAGTASTRSSIWYWIATGNNASGTVTVTPSASEQWRAAVVRVPAGEFDATTPIQWGTYAVATSGAPDIPAITPTWSYGRAIGFCGVDTDPVTSAPSGWTLLTVTTDRGAMNLGVCACNTASTASVEINGGTFSGVDDGWVAAVYLVNAPTHEAVADGRTPLAAAGTDPTLNVDTDYGVSIRVENSGGATTEDIYKWQYKLNGGSWTDVGSSSSVLKASATADFTNGDDVPEYITGSGTYVSNNNAALDTGGSLTLAAVLGANASFESHLNFTIVSGDVVNGDVIYLRIVEEDGTALDSYGSGDTNIPAITVSESGGAYTLTAVTGTFTLTGQAAGLLAGFLLQPVVGTFTLTGIDANLSRGYTVGATTGTFTLTGVDAALLVGLQLTTETGAFNLTGFDAGLGLLFTLTAEPGTFTLTGIDTNLLVGLVLGCTTGTFTLTGIDANLGVGLVLPCEVGTFTWTGYDAGLAYGLQLACGTGAFTLTGNDTGLLAHRLLTASVGTFSLTGIDANLLTARLLSATTGAFTLTGNDTGLYAHRLLSAETVAFIWTGNDAILVYTPVGAYYLTAETGAFALTGQAAALLANRVLTMGTGIFVLTGNAAALVYGALGTHFLTADHQFTARFRKKERRGA